MIEIWWVSESCSSRAMCSRSSSARRRAVSSRVRSASSARRSACRSASPAAPAAISQASSRALAGLRERLARTAVRGDQGRERESGQHDHGLATTVMTRCPARTAAYTANRYATAGTSKPAAW